MNPKFSETLARERVRDLLDETWTVDPGGTRHGDDGPSGVERLTVWIRRWRDSRAWRRHRSIATVGRLDGRAR